MGQWWRECYGIPEINVLSNYMYHSFLNKLIILENNYIFIYLKFSLRHCDLQIFLGWLRCTMFQHKSLYQELRNHSWWVISSLSSSLLSEPIFLLKCHLMGLDGSFPLGLKDLGGWGQKLLSDNILVLGLLWNSLTSAYPLIWTPILI